MTEGTENKRVRRCGGHGGLGGMCSPAAAGFIGWRIDRLEQLIKPADALRSKFDELKEASNEAAEVMRSAGDVSGTTSGRRPDGTGTEQDATSARLCICIVASAWVRKGDQNELLFQQDVAGRI